LIKALGSRIHISSADNDISMEYYSQVGDLLHSPAVKDLAGWGQHMHTSRLQHSINVSYYSFLICRKMGLDARATARGGLLHDLFFFDWRELRLTRGDHVRLHPQHALENAKAITALNDMEQDIIENHMWPCSKRVRYKETLVVSFVDKFCAVTEFFDYVRLYIRGLGCPLR